MATSDWGGLVKGRDAATLHQILTATMLGKSFLVALYLCLNVSLNLVNKWIISHYGFQFPILLSIAHMGFGFLALSPFMAVCKPYRDSHGHTLQKQWAGLLCIGAAFAMNVGMTNASLLTLSLSLQQVIRYIQRCPVGDRGYLRCWGILLHCTCTCMHAFTAYFCNAWTIRTGPAYRWPLHALRCS